MSIERRDFLAGAVAGTAGWWLGRGAASAAPVVETDPAATVPLGKALKTCRLGSGTGMAGGNRQSNMTRLGREKFEALLEYTYEKGVRLFDCADLYGSHPYVGRVMKRKPRDSYQLVTKIWFRRGGLPEAERPDADVVVRRFLKELQTDYLDVVQLHCVTSPKWPEELRSQMDIMARLKEQGVIGAHGVSCHSLGALAAAAEEPWVDVIHARFNPYGMRTDVPKAQFAEKVLPVLKKARANGKGVIGMKLVGEGKFDAAQRAESIRYALQSGCIDVLIVGIEKPGQVDEFKSLVRENLAAMARRPASPA